MFPYLTLDSFGNWFVLCIFWLQEYLLCLVGTQIPSGSQKEVQETYTSKLHNHDLAAIPTGPVTFPY